MDQKINLLDVFKLKLIMLCAPVIKVAFVFFVFFSSIVEYLLEVHLKILTKTIRYAGKKNKIC